MPAIGNKIKKLRELKGFKQEYMAERLGVSQQSYSKLESEKTDVPFSKIEQLAEIFQIKPEELIAFDEKVVFYLNAQYTTANNGVYNNNFPEKMQQLYEDKIKLLEEKVIWLQQSK